MIHRSRLLLLLLGIVALCLAASGCSLTGKQAPLGPKVARVHMQFNT